MVTHHCPLASGNTHFQFIFDAKMGIIRCYQLSISNRYRVEEQEHYYKIA